MVGWDEEVYKSPQYPDLKHYAVPATRRFRAFKLWCVIRNYGVEGIRRYCRNHINLAKLFEKYVKRDDRFEVCGPVRYGLVGFRLRGLNEVTSKLLDALNYSRRIHMVPSHFHDKVVIRFAVCAEFATERDIDDAWQMIDHYTSVLVRTYQKEKGSDPAMQTLYNKQKRHDELEAANKDSRIEDGQKQAERVFAELNERTEPIVKGVDNAGIDGTWDKADESIFKTFDENLASHPELNEETIWHDPTLPKKAQSMLHFNHIKQVMDANGGGAPPPPPTPSQEAAIRQSMAQV